MNNQYEREFGWDDEISQDSEFILLPEGDYVFSVKNYERGRHTPSENGKLPACNKAIINLTINSTQGEVSLKHNLFLHSSTEGLLSAFFGAIGLKKRGEPLRMNWNAVPGAQGVCHIGIREYNGNKFNETKRMIYKEDVDYTKVLNADVGTAAASRQQQAGQIQQQPVQQSFNFGGNPAGGNGFQTSNGYEIPFK